MNKMDRIEDVPETYDLCGQNYWSHSESSLDSRAGISRIGLSKRAVWELRNGSLRSEAQKPISVKYNGQIVGTGLNEGLLLNFGADRLEFKKKFRLTKTDSAASKSTVIL